MHFEKYHGIGNDFVMLLDPDDGIELTGDAVRRLCDRRLGIGGDGVIRVAPGRDGADLFMDYVNADGSIGEMCGNGIRCLALFARAHGLVASDVIDVATRAGLKRTEIVGDGSVRVDMGAPVFEPAQIPVAWDEPDALHAKVELSSGVVEVACLSMGNPHAVLFVDDPATAPVDSLGPEIETHAMFPARTNVEFVTPRGPGRVSMRVWERGVGETLACGTGACAAAAAARVLRDAGERVLVELPGGELEVEWDGSVERSSTLYLTGPAEKAFEGEVDLAALSPRP